MRLQQLDLNLLVIFEAIYRERNLTRVAQQLNITQPAVSNALNRLRERLNDRLFERAHQHMVPTPVADDMIAGVREGLACLQRSIEAPALFEPAQSRKTVAFAMNDLAESLVLGPLLKQVSREAPHMTITSFNVSRREVLAELASGRLDFAVDVPVMSMDDLCHQPLMQEPYVCAMRPGHPALGGDWQLPHYLALSHIHVSSRRSGLGYVDHALNLLGEMRNVQLRVQHYLVAPDIVRETDLVWTLPAALAQRFGLATRPLPFELLPLQLHLIWHRRNQESGASRWLRTLLLDEAQVKLGHH
ncbi:LysR family transcriptional regulator [Simiduia sp. 21SJ11W-1]|uniref:LysR family transcriptional regulator n=1 Tax=Simiduia sp. 21SJ11W-1 TaxID=2909669 RepID=UPI0020A09C1D|nr:LysR family transcriptional regulator [Simiduia sp. 21SJ11W-1]UTA46691.1 LysR family transcriptional regulator [Simiduia sp. 21SJ11W-1]